MKRQGLSSVLGMALLLGGCPHRPSTPRVVYIPSPPPSATTPTTADTTDAMVIEEPMPPSEPAPVAREEEAPAPAQPPRRHRPTSNDPPAVAEPTPEPAAAVPPLGPGANPQQQNALRQQIQERHRVLQQRMGQLDHARLSDTGQKTLEDARTFLMQSAQALEEGDLQRAGLLAQKASLLVDALAQKR